MLNENMEVYVAGLDVVIKWLSKGKQQSSTNESTLQSSPTQNQQDTSQLQIIKPDSTMEYPNYHDSLTKP